MLACNASIRSRHMAMQVAAQRSRFCFVDSDANAFIASIIISLVLMLSVGVSPAVSQTHSLCKTKITKSQQLCQQVTCMTWQLCLSKLIQMPLSCRYESRNYFQTRKSCNKQAFEHCYMATKYATYRQHNKAHG